MQLQRAYVACRRQDESGAHVIWRQVQDLQQQLPLCWYGAEMCDNRRAILVESWIIKTISELQKSTKILWPVVNMQNKRGQGQKLNPLIAGCLFRSVSWQVDFT